MLLWQMKLDMQKRETRTAFGILMGLAVVSFAVSVWDAASCGNEASELLAAYAYGMLHMSYFNPMGMIYLLVAPLAAGIPFAGGLGEYGALGYESILLARCSKRRLTGAKAASAFLTGALLVALPAMLNLLWCVMAFPWESVRNPIGAISSMPSIDYFLSRVYCAQLYRAHPYLYAVAGVLAAGLYGGVCALATLALSLQCRDKHRLIVGLLPFLLVLLISLTGNAYQGLNGESAAFAPVYAYFTTADDTQKLPLPWHVAIWALIAAASWVVIGVRARRKDEL